MSKSAITITITIEPFPFSHYIAAPTKHGDTPPLSKTDMFPRKSPALCQGISAGLRGMIEGVACWVFTPFSYP